jgi:RNA polymerase sigma-70 factor (ECF subfamily)
MFRKKPSFNENDLEGIIAACLLNNQPAQRAFIHMFLSYARTVCFPYVSNKEAAAEVINDGFLKVFNNLHKYDHSRPFKVWFKSILINTAIDHYRKNVKQLYRVNIDYIDIVDDDADIISKISADEILSLVQKLPPAYRLVFNLYVLEGYTHREIAEMLNIGEGTSKSNLRDARKKLQSMIRQNYPHLYFAYSLKIDKINEN